MNGREPIHPGSDDLDRLAEFVAAHRRLFVLTGAGVSTASGIPDYRDLEGRWKRKQPVQYQEFVGSAAVRRRYWARSLIGWRWFARARPNATHRALAELERRGYVHQLVTQNVDGLHQRAGSGAIDLHGRLDTVICLACGAGSGRDEFQTQLEARNPHYAAQAATIAPDGDADLDDFDFSNFDVPDCPHCGGLLKPHVVFFGEAVPKPRVQRALEQLAKSDALLVVGSSLMVFSGFRFARTAHAAGKPIAAVNLGHTRADELLDLKVAADCDTVLTALCERLPPRDERGRVASPCVRNCCLNNDDVCLGCFRHVEEITRWSACNDTERGAILSAAWERRRRHRERFPLSHLQPARQPG